MRFLPRDYFSCFIKLLDGTKQGKLMCFLAGIPDFIQTVFCFFMRLEKINRIEIFRLKSKNKSREVQILQKIPKTQEIFETHETVEVFRQQLAPSVYKVWPVEPLASGDYAVIEYTPGEENLRVWDFTVGAGATSTARTASAAEVAR